MNKIEHAVHFKLPVNAINSTMLGKILQIFTSGEQLEY